MDTESIMENRENGEEKKEKEMGRPVVFDRFDGSPGGRINFMDGRTK